MNINGFVEFIDTTEVRGWAYDVDAIDSHLAISIALDALPIGAGIADIHRPDLERLGLGAGDHAFVVAIDLPIATEDIDSVQVYAMTPTGEATELKRLRAVAAPPEAATPTVVAAPVVAAPVVVAPVVVAPVVVAPVVVAPVVVAPVVTMAAYEEEDPLADIPSRDAVTPLAEPPAARPRPDAALQIFVLGAARSGTSAMFAALSDTFELPGFGESHVIPAFQRMIHQLRQYVELFDKNPEDIMINRMGSGPVEAVLIDYVRGFYRATYGGDSFVDKTPTGEAIYGAPLVEQIFPHAYLVVARRTGIEAVQSFRLKFSSEFADACLAWSEAMSGILRARPLCQNMMEIDQFDMANQPERTGRRLAAWLGREEKAAALGLYFASTRVEKSSTHDWSRRLTLADVTWTAAEKATFMRVCGRMMDAFEYPM